MAQDDNDNTFKANLTRRKARATGKEKIDIAPPPWSLAVSKGFVLPFLSSKATLPFIKPHLTSSHDVKDYMESGGLGLVMLYRYESSPVGPYDELIFSPGAFRQRPAVDQKIIDKPREREMMCERRIPRIYVSTESSLRNGRQNWGIRKELAEFEWIESKGWLVHSNRVIVKDKVSGEVMLDVTINSLPFLSFPLVLEWLGKIGTTGKKMRIMIIREKE